MMKRIKKTKLIFVLLMCVIMLSACSGKKELTLGTYVSKNDELIFIELQSNNNFVLINSPVSYHPTGKYTIKGDKLFLKEDDEYVFSIKNDKLIFESGAWLESFIDKGSEFQLSKKDE